MSTVVPVPRGPHETAAIFMLAAIEAIAESDHVAGQLTLTPTPQAAAPAARGSDDAIRSSDEALRRLLSQGTAAHELQQVLEVLASPEPDPEHTFDVLGSRSA